MTTLRLYSRCKLPEGSVVARDAPDLLRVDMLECSLLLSTREPSSDELIANVHRRFGDRDGQPVPKATLRQYDLKAAIDRALRADWTWR